MSREVIHHDVPLARTVARGHEFELAEFRKKHGADRSHSKLQEDGKYTVILTYDEE